MDHHPFKPIIDVIHAANNADSAGAEYECWSCGHWKPAQKIEVVIIRDSGEPEEVMVCEDCIAKGRHKLLR